MMSGSSEFSSLSDEIFERELALLQPLQMQIVRRHLRREPVNGFIEIAVLGLEGRDPLLDGFNIEVHVTRDYIKKR